jgi:hypothetical protein
MDSGLFRKENKGSDELPLSAGSISTTAVATSRLLQPHLVITPKRTTASVAVRGSMSISVSNAIGDGPSTSPDAGLEARRSRTGLNYLLEFKRASSSSFDLPESANKDTQMLSFAKEIIITALAELGALGGYVLKPIQRRTTEVSKVKLDCLVFQAFLESRPRRFESISGLGIEG